MKVRELLNYWESTSTGTVTQEACKIKLPIETAAKLAALADMYPSQSTEALVTDLLTAALDDLETSLPYVSGSKVISVDELGDPMYEDVGPTPRYLDLTRKHLRRYKANTAN